jgi:uncharacterized protein DUF5916/cellulose/xylan binding protein with CBM9 domain
VKIPGAIIAIFIAARVAFSQEARIPVNYETARLSKIATAVRTTEKITIDGKLEEPAWQLAIPVTELIETRPTAGAPARERTEVRFLYDDENLYVAASCYDSDVKHITLNSIQEDYPYNESDTVSILIDSLHDLRTAFNFNFNAGGAKRDTQVFNDGGSINNDWDGVWDLKTTITDEGWFAEVIIPFKTLRFSKSPTQEWGLNISRRILRMNEDTNWAPIPIRYSNFKISLAGTLTGLENIHQGRNLKVKPFVSAGVTRGFTHKNDADGGVDLKYSLTPSVTLDATYRTDFAQVEVDQQQVNLTRFNLFFPEKRDFFLENTGIFSFGPTANANLVPFFSRRIGLSSAGTPIPILGGARVSGQVKRYDLGFLTMKTERLDATPSNNFFVGRLKRNLLRNSWVGSLVTNRDSTISGDYNRLYGSDAHFQFYNKLEFDSFLLKTETPDRAGRNQARRFETGWKDDEWSLTAEYNEVQPNFNPDVGFVRRRDMEQYSGDAAWKPLVRRSAAIRNLNFQNTFNYYAGSGSGKVETRTSDSTIGIVFENNASINFIVNDTFDRLSTPLRIPSGNPHVAIPAGDYKFLGYTGNVTTNLRRRISGNGALNWGDFYNGRINHWTAGLNLKPNYHLTLNLTYDRNRVTLPNGSFTTDLIGSKLIYGLTPRAFINAYIQYNADTHLISSNLRFNWTHHPLSDLYLVYNDTRDTLTHRARERAFIVKLTNLFNF